MLGVRPILSLQSRLIGYESHWEQIGLKGLPAPDALILVPAGWVHARVIVLKTVVRYVQPLNTVYPTQTVAGSKGVPPLEALVYLSRYTILGSRTWSLRGGLGYHRQLARLEPWPYPPAELLMVNRNLRNSHQRR